MSAFIEQFNVRLLEEMRFWLRIMKEHALFIRLGLPCDETQLIRTAQDFESRFAALEEQVLGFCPRQRQALAREVLNLTLQFIRFKTCILDRLITCSLGGSLFPLLIDHIRREAIRFAENIMRSLRDDVINPTEKLIEDEAFWLRIMADHAKFIAHLLDPSERKFIQQSRLLSDTFDVMRCHIEDFESMLEITPRPIPSLVRFAGETLDAGRDIRDFKRAATQLLCECKVLSIIPPLLADHLRREADKFIQDIKVDLAALGPTVPCPGQPIPPCPGQPMPPCPGPVAPAPGFPCPPVPPCPSPMPPCPGQPTPPCPGLGDTPVADPVESTPAIEPLNQETADTILAESESAENDLAVPPQPLYRPRKTILQPDRAIVKIQFK